MEIGENIRNSTMNDYLVQNSFGQKSIYLMLILQQTFPLW